MFSALDVVASACALLGEDPPASLTDDVPGGAAAGLIYRDVVGFMIGVYPFSFARRFFLLAAVDATPVGYARAFQLPSERVGPPLRLVTDVASPDASETAFTLSGNEVWSSAEAVWAECKVVPDPAWWSATFRKTAVTAIAGELALAFASDRNTHATLSEKAFGPQDMAHRGGFMGAAIAEDARATPPRRLPSSNPLLAARFL